MNKLWYKKIIFAVQISFFISAMTIKSSSLVQALELATLLPVCDISQGQIDDSYKKFKEMNDRPEISLQPPLSPLFRQVGCVRESKKIEGRDVFLLTTAHQFGCVGGEYSCGFHSIKNVLLVLNAINRLVGVQERNSRLAIAQLLQRNLENKGYFEDIFVGLGSQERPASRSWLDFFQTRPDFRPGLQGGIFPGDQKLLLQSLSDQRLIIPEGILNMPNLIDAIFPINGLQDELTANEISDVQALCLSMYALKHNQTRSVAFTLQQNPNSAHFIGIIFYKNREGLEIFVVDSLNHVLDEDTRVVQKLLDWYNKLENYIISYSHKKIGALLVGYYQQTLNQKNESCTTNFLPIMQGLYNSIQLLLLAKKINPDNYNYEIDNIIKKILCFYWNNAMFNKVGCLFVCKNMRNQDVDAHEASDGILPKSLVGFKQMLQYWANSLNIRLICQN